MKYLVIAAFVVWFGAGAWVSIKWADDGWHLKGLAAFILWATVGFGIMSFAGHVFLTCDDPSAPWVKCK